MPSLTTSPHGSRPLGSARMSPQPYQPGSSAWLTKPRQRTGSVARYARTSARSGPSPSTSRLRLPCAGADGADQVERPLLLDELAGEDHRRPLRVEPKRRQPLRPRRPGGVGHGAEAVVVHAVRREIVGNVARSGGRTRRCAARSAARPPRPGPRLPATRCRADPAPAGRRRLGGRVAAEQVGDAEQPARGHGEQDVGIGVTVQDDDVPTAQPAAQRRSARPPCRPAAGGRARSSGSRSSRSMSQASVTPNAGSWYGRAPSMAEEGDLKVHHAAPRQLLVKRRLVLDRVRRQHAKPRAGRGPAPGGIAVPHLRDGHAWLLPAISADGAYWRQPLASAASPSTVAWYQAWKKQKRSPARPSSMPSRTTYMYRKTASGRAGTDGKTRSLRMTRDQRPGVGCGPWRGTGASARAAEPAAAPAAARVRRTGRACAASAPGPCGPRRRCRWPAGHRTVHAGPLAHQAAVVLRVPAVDQPDHPGSAVPAAVPDPGALEDQPEPVREGGAVAVPAAAPRSRAASCGDTHSSASTK